MLRSTSAQRHDWWTDERGTMRGCVVYQYVHCKSYCLATQNTSQKSHTQSKYDTRLYAETRLLAPAGPLQCLASLVVLAREAISQFAGECLREHREIRQRTLHAKWRVCVRHVRDSVLLISRCRREAPRLSERQEKQLIVGGAPAKVRSGQLPRHRRRSVRIQAPYGTSSECPNDAMYSSSFQ